MHYLSCASHRLDCKIKLLLDSISQKLTWLARTIWFIDNVTSIPETQNLIILEKMKRNCLRILLMEETEGMEAGSHTLWESNCSLISQANIPGRQGEVYLVHICSCCFAPGLSVFSRMILFTTDGVATCCT